MPDPRIFPITSVNDTTAAVTDASAIVLAASERVDLEIVNDSDVVVYLSRSNPAVVGEGIRLNPNGGSYSMTTQTLFEGVFYGICNIGEDATITISEGLR